MPRLLSRGFGNTTLTALATFINNNVAKATEEKDLLYPLKSDGNYGMILVQCAIDPITIGLPDAQVSAPSTGSG